MRLLYLGILLRHSTHNKHDKMACKGYLNHGDKIEEGGSRLLKVVKPTSFANCGSQDMLMQAKQEKCVSSTL